MEKKMNVNDFVFPVMCVESDFIRIESKYDSLTTTMKAAIKNGMFRDLMIIDSIGNCLQIKDAKKLYGIGFLWGYNIFLNQKIRVELIPDGEPFNLSLDEVRAKVLKVFRGNRSFWASGGNFEEIEQAILNAKTIPEIIDNIPA